MDTPGGTVFEAPMAPLLPADRLEWERRLWSQGWQRVAGVDEAGRGPLAGPVVAAAVILPAAWIIEGLPAELRGLHDSKQLRAGQREHFCTLLTSCPEVVRGLAAIEAADVDRLNILEATRQAMRLALAQLRPPAEHALVDGLPVPALSCPQTALVQGDARSYAIAAASVLAKVTRDRRMLEYDRQYPEYGFASHKGYPTREHLAALRRHGPCPLHRRTFAPLRAETPLLL